MQAHRLVSPHIGEMELERFELADELPPGSILAKAGVTMISAGTEVANYLGRTTERPPERTEPYYPGYSFAGEVVAVGEGVERFAPGDRITGPLPHASYSVEGRPERLERITHIPDSVDDRAAAFSQLSCIALNGVRKADIKLGERAAVVGAGLVGLLAARLAQLEGGHPVVSFDLVAERRAKALEFGMAAAIDPSSPTAEAEAEAIAPDGFDVVIEATGAASAFVPALELAARGARVILLGSTRGTVEGFSPYTDAHKKGLSIIGAHVWTAPTHATVMDKWTEPANRRVLLSLMAEGLFDVTKLVSHDVAPSEAGAAFAGLAAHPDQYLGVEIDWNRV
ncbi:MAG: 2-desacetyl-2-hydroxyethyl bacteriochlorophyllide dehydrogenase [Rhodoglobus sp.]|nr:2-desacetyl-2-hydroxyethyl bacteriochlorophyllide dehydrogenase [Rhodoglobus sp.]